MTKNSLEMPYRGDYIKKPRPISGHNVVVFDYAVSESVLC